MNMKVNTEKEIYWLNQKGLFEIPKLPFIANIIFIPYSKC